MNKTPTTNNDQVRKYTGIFGKSNSKNTPIFSRMMQDHTSLLKGLSADSGLRASRQNDHKKQESIANVFEGKPTYAKNPLNANDAKLSDENFAKTIKRVECLLDEDEELKPSPYAYAKTLSMIYELGNAYPGIFPRGAVAGTEDSEVYVYWRKEGVSIRLKVPASPSEKCTLYTYLSDGVDFSAVVNIDSITQIIYRHFS